MSEEKIKKYIINDGLVKNPEVEQLGTGEAHLNFLAREHGKKRIVRVNRTDVPVANALYNEHIILRFIEKNILKKILNCKINV